MSLQHFINERLKITSNTKPLSKVQPQTTTELRKIILDTVKKRGGKDVDLNYIDTSKITDMGALFYGTNPRNIKIDEWDVSNVENMSRMFAECKDFNCDLSKWDVSSVKDMLGMFYKCKGFDCDLSKWNVSNVESSYGFVDKCPLMAKDKLPKFR